MNKSLSFAGLAACVLALTACGPSADPGNETTDAPAPAAVTPDVEPPQDSYLDQMQGIWVSDDDPEAVVTIKGNGFHNSLGGPDASPVPITFVDSCSDQNPDQAGKAFTLQDAEGITCYLIDRVTEDKLVYILASRGRMMRFTRQE